MTLDALIMLAGVLVAVLPFLGIPISWFPPMFFVLGALVLVLGIIVRRRGARRDTPRGRISSAHIKNAPEQHIHDEESEQ